MNATIKLGAALLALALLVMPALAFTEIGTPLPSRELGTSSHDEALASYQDGDSSHERGAPSHLGWWLTLAVLAGTTVTYLYPVSNTTTAPTAVQASQAPVVTGLIVWADADTVALFTHNLGIATAPTFAGKLPAISQGFPEVIANYTGISTVVGTVSYTNTSGNVITFAKASLLGTAGTLLVIVRAPNTYGL